MGQLGKEKIDFICDKINLLTYDYNKTELDNVEKLLRLNENYCHPEDVKDNVGLANLASNALSFYIKDIFPYRMKLGGGIKLNPELAVINPLKRSDDNYRLLNENTNNFLKYVRTTYPESISRVAWGDNNSSKKCLKELYPEIISNFNFFNNKKTAVLDTLSDTYYLAPTNIDMLKNVSSYITDPRFKNISNNENPDFYLFSLFLKTVFDNHENEIENTEYESFLKKNVHTQVNISTSEDNKYLLRNVLKKHFKNEDLTNDIILLIRNNMSNSKYENYRKIDDEMIKEMMNYIDPLRFLYSLEIEGEDIGNYKSLKQTSMNYDDYKKLDIFSRYFLESLNYVFALFNCNGTTYTYPLSDTLERLGNDKDIISISIIPIPFNDEMTMFEFFKNLKYKYDVSSDDKFDMRPHNVNNFGLNGTGSIKFIENAKMCQSPYQILNMFIYLYDEYKTNEDVEVFVNNVEKQRFVEFLLKKLGFKVKTTKIIKYNKEIVKLEVEPKPTVSYFKTILSSKKNIPDITHSIQKLSSLINFINSFSTVTDNKGGNNEANNELTFDENHDPIELYNGLDHKAINEYIENKDNPEDTRYNFFTGEDIDFYNDLEYLDENDGITEDNVCNLVPLNIYYKRKFSKRLDKIIKDGGGKKIYDTISEFLKSIEDTKGGLKQVYDNVGELLNDLTQSTSSDQEQLIRSIINSILTSSSLNTYDLSVLKKKISMIDNITSNRDERESNRLMFNMSSLVNKLKGLNKKGITLEMFDNDEIGDRLEKIYFQSLALYQYLNLVDVIRNLFMLLPTYGVTICSNKITNEDLRKIDKMFLQKSLYNKNKKIKRRFDELKSSLGIMKDTEYITVIDEIYNIVYDDSVDLITV